MRVQEWPVDKVVPYENNPRRNDGAVEAVANSIREFGWRQPIVVDADGTVIAGHTRLKAARALGADTVPVVVASDLTPAQVAAYRLADNKVGELAEWDLDMLAEELDGLAADFDMGEFGFDGSDLAPAAGPDGFGDVFEDEPPETVVCRCKPGEVWTLGEHRVMCGSAASADDMAELCGGVVR